MRVLMVSAMAPYLPCHDGFRVIPANLLRPLGDRHELHLIALADGTETAGQLAWPRPHCRSVEILPAASPSGILGRLARLPRALGSRVAQTVRARLQTLEPDALHLEGPSLAPLAALGGGIRTVLSAHDALSLRYREFATFARSRRERAVYGMREALARRFERRWVGRADRVVVTSPVDLEALRRSVPGERLTVIPNGVDLDYFAYRPDPRPGRLVFTGNMSWPPNEDAAEHFATEVFPRIRRAAPGAEFWIAGASPSARVRALERHPGVHVTGTVPDLREWIWSASVYVSPIRFGVGVKNKILEAMALGAPIVATPKSLTGTPLVHGRHLLVAEDSAHLAESVAKVLHDDALAHRLSKAARLHVEHEYAWESIAARFEALYG
ncbi:MAG: glycosyltransferase family 4 protein [Actinomycetota bacterium]